MLEKAFLIYLDRKREIITKKYPEGNEDNKKKIVAFVFDLMKEDKII